MSKGCISSPWYPIINVSLCLQAITITECPHANQNRSWVINMVAPLVWIDNYNTTYKMTNFTFRAALNALKCWLRLFWPVLTKVLIERDFYIMLDLFVRIDQVFAPGAVVGRAITHEWGRLLPRAQRWAGWPHECVVAHPITAPEVKMWSISILPQSFRSGQSNHVMFEAELSAVKSVIPASNQRHLPRRIRRYARAMTSKWQTNVIITWLWGFWQVITSVLP